MGTPQFNAATHVLSNFPQCISRTRYGSGGASDAKLYRSANGFTLHDGGRRYVFSAAVGSNRWFLSAIHTDQWSGPSTVPIVSSVIYATPSFCTSGPYIQFLELGDARQLQFHYANLVGGCGPLIRTCHW